jgi:hypothetical protein
MEARLEVGGFTETEDRLDEAGGWGRPVFAPYL